MAPGAPDEGEPGGSLDSGPEIRRLLARFREALLRRPDDMKSLASVAVQIERAAVRSKGEEREMSKQERLERAMYNVQMQMVQELFPDKPEIILANWHRDWECGFVQEGTPGLRTESD